jgi:hypothetical protein
MNRLDGIAGSDRQTPRCNRATRSRNTELARRSGRFARTAKRALRLSPQRSFSFDAASLSFGSVGWNTDFRVGSGVIPRDPPILLTDFALLAPRVDGPNLITREEFFLTCPLLRLPIKLGNFVQRYGSNECDLIAGFVLPDNSLHEMMTPSIEKARGRFSGAG